MKPLIFTQVLFAALLSSPLIGPVAHADPAIDQLSARIAALEKDATATRTNRIPVGTILPFAGGALPSHYLAADGKVVDEEHDAAGAYAALCSVIRDQFRQAQDPVGICRLPDLRGRGAIGEGQGEGLSARALGQMLGEEKHSLTVEEMPSHTHSDLGHTHRERYLGSPVGGNPSINGNFNGGGVGQADNESTSVTDVAYANIQPTGGGQPHSLMQPSLVVKYGVKF